MCPSITATCTHYCTLTVLFISEGWSSVYNVVGLVFFLAVAAVEGDEAAADGTSVSSYTKAGCFCSLSSSLLGPVVVTRRDDLPPMVLRRATASLLLGGEMMLAMVVLAAMLPLEGIVASLPYVYSSSSSRSTFDLLRFFFLDSVRMDVHSCARHARPAAEDGGVVVVPMALETSMIRPSSLLPSSLSLLVMKSKEDEFLAEEVAVVVASDTDTGVGAAPTIEVAASATKLVGEGVTAMVSLGRAKVGPADDVKVVAVSLGCAKVGGSADEEENALA